MKVGIIGGGKAGCSLGRYFIERGIHVSGIYERDRKQGILAEKKTGVSQFSSIKELLISSSVAMVCVNDDEIGSVWEEIRSFDIEGKTVFHISGAVSTEVFQGDTAGAETASLHPMMSFSGEDTPLEGMEEMTVALEGSNREMEKLVELMGNRCIRIPKGKKVSYHLAGVYACNLLVPMIERGIENLRRCGLDDGEAMAVLMPLIRKTIDTIESKGSRGAISGPLERGDAGTIKKHLECQGEEERKLYIEGSKELLRILEREDNEIEGIMEGRI